MVVVACMWLCVLVAVMTVLIHTVGGVNALFYCLTIMNNIIFTNIRKNVVQIHQMISMYDACIIMNHMALWPQKTFESVVYAPD